MIIPKALYINRFEPALFNVRIPMGLEAKIDVTYYANGSNVVYNQDVAGQLQLTPRSGGAVSYHQMPSIDVVNGKARAIIPADTLNDPNGYALRITGTVDGDTTLLAMGSVFPLSGAGVQTTPTDAIDSIDLAFERNEDVSLNVRLWDDASKTDPFDFTATGTSITANIYSAKAGSTLVPFLVTVVSPNEVTLVLTVDQVNVLPDSCWWSMNALSSAGLTTLCEGSVTVTGVIIPPLETTVAVYDYLKPAGSVNPVGGQIIHSTIEQNLLKVAKSTGALQDITATLALIRAGDQIQIGVTVWTVVQSVEAAGWFEFMVSPVQLASVDGTTTVTFTRP